MVHIESRIEYAAATEHTDGTLALYLGWSADVGHDPKETGIKSADNHVM